MRPAGVDHESESSTGWARKMAAAQDGDRAAYDQLLREILPYIRTVVAAHHRRPDRIEDVVQDVLLTIHRVRHTYDPARPFRPWLAAIARRRSIDALRRRGRTDAMEVSNDLAYETFADPDANREIEASHKAAGLSGAIAALPQSQREAVELVKLKEMSLAEASRATGKSMTALKVNVHRAIKALRVQLTGEPK